MKKLYFLTFTILISSLSFGQTTVFINEIHYDNINTDINEGFEIAGPAGTDLSTYTVTLYNGSNGSAYNTISLSGTIPDEGSSGYGAIWFGLPSNGLQNGSPDGLALDNGGTLIQFLSYEGSFTAVGGVADAISSTDIGVSESSSTTTDTESLQLTGTGLTYENFTWSSPIASTHDAINTGQTFSTPVPSLSLLDGPTSGSTVDLGPEDLSGELEFVVTNFNVDTEGNGGDGYIEWNVVNINTAATHDSGGPLYDLTPDPFIPLEPNENYFFVAELIYYGSGSVAAQYNLHINTLGYNVVADIAAVRAGTEDLYYEITGEVIVSFVTGNSRNQIFIQDATGGILIDDPDGIISTLYNNNDGITGLKGMLTSFGNMSELVATTDPGTASSTSNTITPLSVTINDLLNNIDTYESELVQITDVTFAAGDGVTAFASSTDYDISDQSGGPLVFRTNYPNDNMAGELIPNTPTTIIVIAGQYFNTIQVYPLSPSITLSSSKYNQIEGFAMYPNPTSLGYVNIISKNQSALRVGVHDILGKQVINKTISNNRLDVSTLTTGIYIIKISQDDAITTRKLIIK